MTSSLLSGAGLPGQSRLHPDWHLLSRLVVRRTGLPYDWLERLRAGSAAQHADLAARQRAIAEAAAAAALGTCRAAVDEARQAGDRASLRAISRVRRLLAAGTADAERIARYRPWLPPALLVPLDEMLDARGAMEAQELQTRQALAVEDREVARALRQLVTDPLFAQAVFLSNPDMYQASLARLAVAPGQGQPAGTDAVPPKLAGPCWAYLQRFCGKNDTASFVGPLNYAAIVPDGRPVRIETAPGRWRRREVFVSFWAVTELARRIGADAEVYPWLSPRRHPMCRLDGPIVHYPAQGRRVRLPAPLADIARLADGTATILEIAAVLGRDPAEAAAAVRRLADARVLIAAIDVPSTRFHPLTELRREVAALDPRCPGKARWLALIDEFEELRVRFRDAEFADRPQLLAAMDAWFEATTGVAPRRNQGGTYADRTLFYEDCEGTHPRFDFSASFAADLLERIRPILDLCAAHAALLAAHYGRLGRRVFDELSPAGDPLPYLRFAQVMLERQRAGQLAATDAAVEELRDRLLHLVGERSDGSVARLERADVDALTAGIAPLRNCHVSPDIMLAARDVDDLTAGRYTLVLGEIHQVLYAWGSQLYFADDAAAVEGECERHVRAMPDYADMAVVLNERRHKGLLNDTFPGTFIEVAAVPSRRARSRVAIADVNVVAEDQGLALRHRDTGARYRLYMAGEEQLHLWAVALPRVTPVSAQLPEGHTPRIEIAGAVYQRARWRLPAREWCGPVPDADSADLLLQAAHVRLRHGLPRQCYLHAQSEPKPYFVDFGTPLALRLLRRLAAANEWLTFTEMLPAPDDLWLREEGLRYTCELRMSAYRYATDAEQGDG